MPWARPIALEKTAAVRLVHWLGTPAPSLEARLQHVAAMLLPATG